MNETGSARVIVGLSGSLASLQALRRAVAEARCRGATLHVVYAYPATCTSQPYIYPVLAESRRLVAHERLAAHLDDALGGPPCGLPLRGIVVEGLSPAAALLAQVRSSDDLLVVGTGGRSRHARLWRISVAEQCTHRAACPVLVVPPPPLARELGRRRRRWRDLERHLAGEIAGVQRLPRRR